MPKLRKIYLFVALLLPLSLLQAQVACSWEFQYSEAVDFTFLPDSPPTQVLASGAEQPGNPDYVSPTDEDIFPDIAIGFPFNFEGKTYTKFGVATNGWIWFGPVAPVKAAGMVMPFTNVLMTSFPIEGIVSALNADLEGRFTAGAAEIRVRTQGNSPNRTCTIEWKNFKSRDEGEGTGYCGDKRNRFDFQIILHEQDSRISFAYNASPYCWQGYEQFFQIGIRNFYGEVHSRSIPAGSNSWARSTQGRNYSTAIIRSSAPVTLPAANARFTFIPSGPVAFTWQGANTNWFDPANWGGAVPGICNDVIIPAGLSYYPELDGNQSAECANLTIQPGASLNLKGSYTSFLNVHGSVINSGTLVNNTSSYISLSGTGANTLGGEGHFLATDFYISGNSSYRLINDLVVRNLYIGEEAVLSLGNNILDVYSLIQKGVLDQGSGILVIEGGPASVQLNDSLFKGGLGTTFFGNGEVWASGGDQIVPSLAYNNLWIRTNKPHKVQLGTTRDFSCNDLMFYNPGAAGGEAFTARNITVRGNLLLGIDNQPGTDLTLNHSIRRANGGGEFTMGATDRLNISYAGANSEALSGFQNPVFRGLVAYLGDQNQRVVPGTYQDISIKGRGKRSIYSQVNLRGVLSVEDGELETGGLLSIKSDSTGTGLISGAGQGSLSGEVQMERYIAGTDSQVVFVAPAFHGLRLDAFSDYVPFLGPEGVELGHSNLPTVWRYDVGEDYEPGWYSENNKSLNFEAGKGRMLRIKGSETITLQGLVNSGTFRFPLSTTGEGAKRGLNLIGNPYPSPLNWNQIAESNASVSQVYYSMKPGRSNGHYASWLPLGGAEGLGINGAGGYIGSQESFFVRAFAVDSLRLNNSFRADIVNVSEVRPPENTPYIRLSMTQQGKRDEILIYYSVRANSDLAQDGTDALKMPSLPGLSYWFSCKDSVDLGIQGRSKTEAIDSVALGVVAAEAGSHEFRFTEAMNLSVTAMVFFEDRETGLVQNLKLNPSVTINLEEGAHRNRFYLYVHPGITVRAFREGCEGGDGRISFRNPTASAWNISVFNSMDSLVAEKRDFTGTWEKWNLPADEYRVHYSLVGGNFETDEWLKVEEGNRIEASIAILSQVDSEDGSELKLESTTADAEGLFWDFGDGMMLSGDAVVSHIFEQEGYYRVVLTATRGECSDTASIGIRVAPPTGIADITEKGGFSIIPNPASTEAVIRLNNEKALRDAELVILDITGRIVHRQTISRIEAGELVPLPVERLREGKYEVLIGAGSFRSVSRLIVAGK